MAKCMLELSVNPELALTQEMQTHSQAGIRDVSIYNTFPQQNFKTKTSYTISQYHAFGQGVGEMVFMHAVVGAFQHSLQFMLSS